MIKVSAIGFEFVAGFVGVDAGRPHLAGVHIRPHPKKDGAVLVASDGRSMAVWYDKDGVANMPTTVLVAPDLVAACGRGDAVKTLVGGRLAVGLNTGGIAFIDPRERSEWEENEYPASLSHMQEYLDTPTKDARFAVAGLGMELATHQYNQAANRLGAFDLHLVVTPTGLGVHRVYSPTIPQAMVCLMGAHLMGVGADWKGVLHG